MTTDVSTMKDRSQKIRDLIENARPADEYFAECAAFEKENLASVYQKHLDALMEEYDALVGDEYINKREAISIRSLVCAGPCP